MFGSNWRGLYAFIALGTGLVLVFTWLLWSLSSTITEERIRSEYDTEKSIEYAKDSVHDICAGLTGTHLTECVYVEIQAAYGHNRADQDLRAQKDMALWAKIMSLVAIIGAIITAVGVIFVWKTLTATNIAADAARKSVDVAKDMGEVQTRAYLSVTSGTLKYRIDGWPIASLTIRNSGNSPAYDVHLMFVAKGPRGEAATDKSFSDCIHYSKIIWLIAVGGEVEIAITPEHEKTLDWGRNPSPNADVGARGGEFECVLIYKTVFGRTENVVDADEAFHFYSPTPPIDVIDPVSGSYNLKIERSFPLDWVDSLRAALNGNGDEPDK